MGVLSEVIRKCKAAMRAGTPLIYIKTDSYELIKTIVESEELVVLVTNISSEKFTTRYRPYRECRLRNDAARPDNWEEKLESINAWKYPHIVTINADGGINEYELRRYVRQYTGQEDALGETNKSSLLRSSAVILYSEQVKLSENLLQYCEVIEVGYPDFEEIRELVQKTAAQYGESITGRPLQRLCGLLQGFDGQEMACALHKALTRDMQREESNLLVQDGELVSKVCEIIQEQKKQKFRNADRVLNLIPCENEKIGGMEALTSYIRAIRERRLMENENLNKRMNGISAPKGILLCGIPGCGKSLAAKLTAQELGLPLLQMDIGRLMGGIQGQSEENMRKALALAEAMSPCVLWIDEMEKGFSGARSDGAADGGTFKRMFGTLLNWMQENQKPCFIFATANDMGGLPKELFRSGRFDELFAVYLPTAIECADIFLTCTKKAIDSTREYREKAAMKQLIAGETLDLQMYLDIVNTCLVEEADVRIIIGSDIQKIVNSALANLNQDFRDTESITRREWKEALMEETIKCSVYGDSPENIDSIAISYCRMLRKGLRPTVGDKALFWARDYQAENILTGEDRNVSILRKRRPQSDQPYDIAVYHKLYARINKWAYDVESYERRKLLEV